MAGWLVSLNLVEEKTISGENLIKVFSINWLSIYSFCFRFGECDEKLYHRLKNERERERNNNKDLPTNKK